MPKSKNIPLPATAEIEEEYHRVRYRRRFRGTVRSTIFSLVVVAALAVLCGSFLAAYINPKYVRIASAVLFIILGVVSLSQLAWTSKEFDDAKGEKTEKVETEQK